MSTTRAHFKFLSLANVTQRNASTIGGMELQVGDPITCWVQSLEDVPIGVDGYLIGVNIDIGPSMNFNVAFPVAGHPDLFVPVLNFEGRVLPRGENYDGTPRETNESKPSARFAGLRVVADNTVKQPSQVEDELPVREAQPGDNQPVYLKYPADGEVHYPYWKALLEAMTPEERQERAAYFNPHDGTVTLRYANRPQALQALAAFLRIREGYAPVEELQLMGETALGTVFRKVREHGVPQSVEKTITIEYPMSREVWSFMTSQLPENSFVVFESQLAFQVEYPDAATMNAEVERFRCTFPELTNKWKPVE